MKKVLFPLTIIIIIFSLCSCGAKEQPTKEQLQAICELSTIKAYYNNVAKSTKESGKNWWNVLEKDREFWIEYDGVAEIGIDMDKLDMKTDGKTVYITLPDAELLNTRIVRETFSEDCYITNSDNWWDKNKITTEDQQIAINKAQAKMQENVMSNKGLFDRAERVAKETIQNYFNKINELTNSNYEIVWE